MSDKTKSLLKNLGILSISNFASKILVFLLVPLYTSVLSTTEYGIYDLVVSTISLLMPILSLNIIDAVMRFIMSREYNKTKVLCIGVVFISISSVCIAIILFVIHRLGILQQIKGLEVYIFLYYISYIGNQFFIQVAKGLDRVKIMGFAGVLGTIIMIFLNIIFLLVFRWGLYGFFLANILAQIVPMIYFYVQLKFWYYIYDWHIDGALLKEMLLFCTPLLATVAGWWINSASDKYIVTLLCGVAINGLLAVAYKIPAIINTLQIIFIQAWQISAIKEYGDKDTSVFYGKTFSIINILMCSAASGLLLLTKPVARLLYARDFYAAWELVPFLVISSVINCASGFLGPILAAKKDSRSMALSAIYGAIVNLLLNIVLVYYIGAQGATIATLIASYIIYQVRKNSVKNDIYIEKYWNVLLTWILLCFQAVIVIYWGCLYVELLLMATIVLLNKSTFIQVINKILQKPNLMEKNE